MLTKQSRKFWITYTALFTATFALIMMWFWAYGRSLNWEHDGLTQHFKAAVWYSEYLRGGLKGLFSGTPGAFSHFNASVGEGADVFQAFHYYVLGDPFALFTIFFSRATMYLYFYLTVYMRLFCAGAAFILFYREAVSVKASEAALLAGALAYVFCDWSLYNIDRHVFFLNPLFYLPLLLLGVEKIFKKKSPAVFTLAVCISALSNFYFFYMLVLATVVYVVIRWVFMFGKNAKEGVLPLVKLVLSSVLGVAMAAAVLLPVLGIFLKDERMSGGLGLSWVYGRRYYSSLLSYLVKPGKIAWTRIGSASPVLLGGIVFFTSGEWKKKTARIWLVFLGVLTLFLAVPAFGQIFNGFSYVSNRWSWAVVLFNVSLFVLMWEKMQALSLKQRLLVSAVFSGYLILSGAGAYVYGGKEDLLCVGAAGIIGFGWLWIGAIAGLKEKKAGTVLLFLGMIAGIFLLASELYSPYGAGYAKSCLKIADLEKKILNNQAGAAAQAASAQGLDSFYRFSGEEDFTQWNSSLLVGNSGTAYYWSISNPYKARYIDFLQTGEDFAFQTYGYHYKTIPTTLSAVRYYVTKEENPQNMPYGYSFLGTQDLGKNKKGKKKDLYQVYENEYALPAITTYDSYCLQSDVEKLSTPARQMAMMESAMLTQQSEASPEDGAADLSALSALTKVMPTERGLKQDYTTQTVGKKVSVSEGQIRIGKKETGIRLEFEPMENCEPYLVIENLQYTTLAGKEGSDQVVLSVLANGETREITHNRPGTRYYRGVHDYTLCLANQSDLLEAIEITFSHKGIYSFDSMKIVCLPMEEYPALAENLKADTGNAPLTIEGDKIETSVSVSKDKLLCFSFPYSDGWTAYLDGSKTDLLRVNVKDMGVMVPKGSHTVTLLYHTPLLAAGICISLIGWIVFLAVMVWQGKRLKGSEKAVKSENP